MHLNTLCFVLCSGIILVIQGVPAPEKVSDYNSDDYYNADDENADEHEKVVHRIPKLISQSSTLLINEGDTIKLPCLADKLDGFVLMWKKAESIIAVGNRLMSNEDTRVKLEENENGNTLVISLAEPQDAGEYLCQISAQNKPSELRHTVRIRVAPEIKSVPESGVIVVMEGKPATLACEVSKGSPPPKITWRRKEGRKLPGGEDVLRGLSINFPSTSRKNSGFYVCAADNGFGTPATATIKLDVEHAPTIEQGQTFIHTRENDETEVTCEVHAQPKAEVSWYRNGKELTKDQGIFSQRGNKHTLILPGIKESTFGSYTCRATNKYGSDEKTTEVSGKAGPVSIKSSPDGDERTRYALEWVAESITAITAFKLQYRKVSEHYVETPNNEAQDKDSDWIEVRVSPMNNGDHFYSGKFIIENLEPASHYVARISSNNNYGYGPFSQQFRFGTKGAVIRVQETMRTSLAPVQQPSTGGAVRDILSPLCFVLVALSSIRFL